MSTIQGHRNPLWKFDSCRLRFDLNSLGTVAETKSYLKGSKL